MSEVLYDYAQGGFLKEVTEWDTATPPSSLLLWEEAVDGYSSNMSWTQTL